MALCRWWVGVLIDMRFAKKPSICCKQEVAYCRQLRDGTDQVKKELERDLDDLVPDCLD